MISVRSSFRNLRNERRTFEPRGILQERLDGQANVHLIEDVLILKRVATFKVFAGAAMRGRNETMGCHLDTRAIIALNALAGNYAIK